MRELCAGVNVDLGTAAAFRDQWSREAETTQQVANKVTNTTDQPKKLLLRMDQAPGDAVAMTAAIYSLHKAHPGKYITAVESYWPDVFAHNPDVLFHRLPESKSATGFEPIQMHYPAIHQSNERGIHFMQGWCEFLGTALNIQVPLLTNRPRLYFQEPQPPVEDFWLVCSGGKKDFTNKLWGQERYQAVIDRLRGKVNFVQVGGAKPIVPWNVSCMGSQQDSHPLLRGVYDMTNVLSLRGLFDLARKSRGILCGVSLLMHVAAALEKPAVVIAGGREPVAWNAYPMQQYVHTVGALPCKTAQGQSGGACWRARVEPLGDGASFLDQNTCERPVNGVPECMRIISSESVAELVLRYNQISQ